MEVTDIGRLVPVLHRPGSSWYSAAKGARLRALVLGAARPAGPETQHPTTVRVGEGKQRRAGVRTQLPSSPKFLRALNATA